MRTGSIPRILLALSCLIGAALTALPSTSVSAYSGLQTPRDELDTCCTVYGGGGWQVDRSKANGYDTSTAYNVSTNGVSFSWYPYPNPSPTMECQVIHIANTPVYSFNDVWYYGWTTHNGANPLYGAVQVYQRSSLGYWINFAQWDTYSSDYIQADPDTNYTSSNWSADVVEFHYNSDYKTCSF